MDLTFLTLGWWCFFGLHSLLAHNSVKKYIKQVFHKFYPYYRLTYNILNLLFFLLLLYYQFSLAQDFFIKQEPALQVLGAIFITFGIIILYKSFAAFNKKEFLGIEQLEKTSKNIGQKKPHLIKTGLYAYVRHPLYFGLILFLLGSLALHPSFALLCFVSSSLAYLPIGVYLEEQKLIEEFGPDYIQYQKEVKMLVPFIF